MWVKDSTIVLLQSCASVSWEYRGGIMWISREYQSDLMAGRLYARAHSGYLMTEDHIIHIYDDHHVITSSSDNHHKVIWFTHARHIQAKSNPVHAVMILIMSRDEVFMGQERGKPSWCRIDTYISRKRQFSNNAEIACSRQKREII